MHDKVVTLRPAALQRRKDNRRATALDSEQSPIQTRWVVVILVEVVLVITSVTCRDVVKVVEGPHSGRQGEIKHLFRNFAFLHSRMMTDNGGMFAVKCRHLLGVKTFGGAAPRALPAVPRGGLAGMMSPRLSPAHGSSSPAPGAAGGSGRGRGVGRDRDFVGQTVKITQVGAVVLVADVAGNVEDLADSVDVVESDSASSPLPQGPYKGHIGMVKDATESTARVELHAKCQVPPNLSCLLLTPRPDDHRGPHAPPGDRRRRAARRRRLHLHQDAPARRRHAHVRHAGLAHAYVRQPDADGRRQQDAALRQHDAQVTTLKVPCFAENMPRFVPFTSLVYEVCPQPRGGGGRADPRALQRRLGPHRLQHPRPQARPGPGAHPPLASKFGQKLRIQS